MEDSAAVIVRYNGSTYLSLSDANTDTPGSSLKWMALGSGGTDPLSRLKASLSPGYVGLYVFNAADYANGSGTTLYDQSGNENTCTLSLGSNLTWSTAGSSAYQLSWGPTYNNTSFASCTTIASPRTLEMVMSGTPVSIGSGSIAMPLAGYSQSTNGFSVFTQNKISATAPAFLIGYAGTITAATVPASYNLMTYVLGDTQAHNGTYLNAMAMPYLDTANGPGVVNPAGGYLLLGGSSASGFSGGRSAQNMNLTLAVVRTTAATAAQVQQDYAAIREYMLTEGIDIASRGTYASTPQTYNVVCGGTSIMAGYGSGTPPCSSLALGSTYTVNLAAVPSSGIQSHRLALANVERYFYNPLAGRNIYVQDGPTNVARSTVRVWRHGCGRITADPVRVKDVRYNLIPR